MIDWIEISVLDQHLPDILHRRRNLRHIERIPQLQPRSVHDLARIRRLREILFRRHLPDEPAVFRDEADRQAAARRAGINLNILIAARRVKGVRSPRGSPPPNKPGLFSPAGSSSARGDRPAAPGARNYTDNGLPSKRFLRCLPDKSAGSTEIGTAMHENRETMLAHSSAAPVSS